MFVSLTIPNGKKLGELFNTKICENKILVASDDLMVCLSFVPPPIHLNKKIFSSLNFKFLLELTF